jgi:hypothetical protein
VHPDEIDVFALKHGLELPVKFRVGSQVRS